MKSIFETLNNIDDSESLSNKTHLRDILHSAILVVVDNAKEYDINNIVNEFAKDHEDELPFNESFDEPDVNEHMIITKDDLDVLLQKVSECRYFDIKDSRPKNAKFIAEHELTEPEIINIVKQLNAQDYCYTLKSKNKFHEGALLHVFISGKEFDLGTRIIDNISMYIKIEYTSEGFVCVVSIHAPEYDEEHPYADNVEEDNND